MTIDRVTICWLGDPVAKARPHSIRKGSAGNKAMRKTMAFQEAFGWAAKAEMQGQPPIAGPVSAMVSIELPIPESWPKWKKLEALAGRILPCVRPDLSNYLKAIEDSLNGIVVEDDGQIIRYDELHKRYSAEPKVVVRITPWSAIPAHRQTVAA